MEVYNVNIIECILMFALEFYSDQRDYNHYEINKQEFNDFMTSNYFLLEYFHRTKISLQILQNER